VNDYFKTVTLGAFTWKNEERIALLIDYIRKTRRRWLALHFLLLTICLNFPVMFQITRLSPNEFFSRLYSGNSNFMFNEQENENIELSGPQSQSQSQSLVPSPHSNYGREVLLPTLAFLLGVMLIIQIAFYLSAVFLLGVSRMNMAPLSFKERFGLSVFSSTLPVLAASVFGLFLPTVHIIVYYFLIIFFVFQRSKLCPNG